MNWLGIGLGAGGLQGLVSAGDTAQPAPSLRPGDAWQGLAGSGFAQAPTDPTRTTAKPAVRLITPPFQWFTEALEVGVIAAANEYGTLRNNLGIEQVIFHFEGNSHAVLAPRWYTIATQRGPRTYFGWWIRLRKPADRAGHAHLYVEAVARDPSMQRRVIGPFTYSPQPQLYDATLAIAPSADTVVGSRYKSLTAAISWCKANGRVNPLITITEPGIYAPGTSAGETYTAPGYCNITASVPGVTIGNTQAQLESGTFHINNDRVKLHLFGVNLTVDFLYAGQLLQSAANASAVSSLAHWLDGITLTNTHPLGVKGDFNGSGAPRTSNNRLIQSGAWHTETSISEVHFPLIGAQLVRGCTVHNIGSDVANSARCILGSTFTGNDGRFWVDDRPAFSVTYSGPEEVATLARSGAVIGIGGGVWTCVIGATSYTFTTGSPPNYSPRDGLYFADVVAWLNGLPGISATLLIEPFDRRASSGSLPGLAGDGFGAKSIKSAPLTVVSNFDLHSDWYQHQAGGDLENIVIAFNEVRDSIGQIIFLSPPTPAPRDERDVMIFGNVFHSGVNSSGSLVGGSQWGRPNLPLLSSHVVWTHNTFVNQQILIRNEGGGLVADSYCLMKNNVAAGLYIIGPAPVANLMIDGLHLNSANSIPAGAVNVNIGGNTTNLFSNAAQNDFRPAGDLLAYSRVAALPCDMMQRPFTPAATDGALAR